MHQKIVQFPARKRQSLRPTLARVLAAACFVAVGFGIGVIVTLKVVGFS